MVGTAAVPSPSAVLEVDRLCFDYMAGTPLSHKVLRDVSFTVYPGERIAIVGHNGGGKSTLLQLLAGLLEPSAGRVRLFGGAVRDRFRADPRHGAGVLFQFAEHQLFASTVEEDVAFGPQNQGLSSSEVAGRVGEALQAVGLSPDVYAERHPLSLSGGERRRVALAGVLALHPSLLLLDEPTVGLDPEASARVEGVLEQWALHSGRTLLAISHDMDWVARFATKVFVMDQGALAAEGGVSDLIASGAWEALGLELPGAERISRRLRALGIRVEGVQRTSESLARVLLTQCTERT